MTQDPFRSSSPTKACNVWNLLNTSLRRGAMELLQRKTKNKDPSFFLKNGSLLLKELIISCDGKCNPIRNFSAHQILKATDNFHQSHVVREGSHCIWYKGIIENRPALIRKAKIWNLDQIDQIYCNISVSSQMSSHKNVLRLLGCCLDFEFPILVHEYAENGPLNEQGGINTAATLPLKIRLKIAREIADAVTYLHLAFPRTIIHRDITPNNIFLDGNWIPKLSCFSLCISIPEGKSSVCDKLRGAAGYIDPDYARTGIITESTDVFNFGVFLLVLLTGRCSYMLGPKDAESCLSDYVSRVKNGCFISVCDFVSDSLIKNGGYHEVIDTEMSETTNDVLQNQRWQTEASFELALRCTRHIGEEDVVKMIDVAKELRRIQDAPAAAAVINCSNKMSKNMNLTPATAAVIYCRDKMS